MKKKEKTEKGKAAMPRPLKQVVKPSWIFLWIYEKDLIHDRRWKSREYKAPDIETACKKMIDFLKWRDDSCIDHEVYAKHLLKNIDLYSLEKNPMAGYIR